jgi:hypothetical protein
MHALIQAIHTELKGAYGSPRMVRELRDHGFTGSKQHVERWMRENDIRARYKRRFKATTDSKACATGGAEPAGSELRAARAQSSRDGRRDQGSRWGRQATDDGEYRRQCHDYGIAPQKAGAEPDPSLRPWKPACPPNLSGVVEGVWHSAGGLKDEIQREAHFRPNALAIGSQ